MQPETFFLAQNHFREILFVINQNFGNSFLPQPF